VQPDIPFDGEATPCFYGEWWRPKSQLANPSDAIRYAKIFSTSQSWERDPGYTSPIWHKAMSSMYSWIFKGKPQSIHKNGLKVGKKVLDNVRAYIKRLQEEEAQKAQQDEV